MSSRIWRFARVKACSAPNMPMSSPIPVQRPMRQRIWRCWNRVMSFWAMRLDHGGHLTHGSSAVNFSGELYDFKSYGVTTRIAS